METADRKNPDPASPPPSAPPQAPGEPAAGDRPAASAPATGTASAPATGAHTHVVYKDKAMLNRIMWYQAHSKMILSIVVGVVFLLVLIGGFVYVMFTQNAHRFERRGDAAVARGEFQQSIPFYGRSIWLSRNLKEKIRLRLKLVEVLEKCRLEDSQQAFVYFQNLLGLLEENLNNDPQNQPSLQLLTRHYYRLANDLGGNEAWDKLQERADRLLQLEPGNLSARKFRGIAQTLRMGRLPVEEKLRKQALDDLKKAAAGMPDDAESVYYQAIWYLQESKTLRGVADKAGAEKCLDDALAAVGAFADKRPADPAARLNDIRVSMEVASIRKDSDLVTRTMGKAAALEKQLLAQPALQPGRELAVFLRMSDLQPVKTAAGNDVPRGVLRACEILTALAKTFPDRQDIQYEQALMLRQAGRLDEAVEAFAKAGQPSLLSVGPEVVSARNRVLMAKFELINTLLQKRDKAANRRTAAQLLEDAQKYFEEFKKIAQSSPAVDVLEGRMNFARGNYWQALANFESADSRTDRKNVEVSLYAGRALARLGQWNAALTRLESVISNPVTPQDFRIQAAKEIAGVLTQMGRLQEAFRLEQGILKVAPHDASVILQAAQTVLAAFQKEVVLLPDQGGNQAALWMTVARVKTLVAEDNQEACLALASLLVQAGDKVQAREQLAQLLRKDPDHEVAIRQVLSLEFAIGMEQTALDRIQSILNARPDQPVNGFIKQAIAAGSGPLWARLPDLAGIAVLDDAFRRDMELSAILREAGQAAAAEQAWTRAEALRPADRTVLSFRFEEALGRGEWDAAARVIERGESAQLGPEDVQFWKGRLALAKKQYPAAVDRLTQVIRERPQYSDAWALLGDAHRLGGDLGTADSDYQKALDLKRDNGLALQGRFFLYDAWQQRDKAIATLQMMLSIAPLNTQLQTLYADYVSQYGDKAEAIRIRKVIESFRPQDDGNQRALARLYLAVRQPDEAKRILDVLLARAPDNRDNVVGMAYYRIFTGDTAGGRAFLEDWLKRIGKAATADDWLLLARYLRQAGDADAAVKAYETAISLQGEQDIRMTIELADWFMQRREMERALDLYRDARKRTQNPDIWAPIVEILVRLKRYPEAEKSLASWQAVAPDAGVRQNIMGAVLARERGQFAEARRLVEQAIGRDANNANLYLIRAQINTGDTEKEMQERVKGDLEKALQLDPSLAGAREMLVEWYNDHNRVEEARENLQRLITQRPDVISYRVQMAQQYLRTERYDALERLLNDSMERLPQEAVWHQLKAALRRAQNRPREAIDELSLAYKLQKTPETLRAFLEALVGSGNTAPALKLMDEAKAAVDASAVLLALRARALIAQQKDYSADADIARALDLAVKDYALLDEVVAQLRTVMSEKDLTRRLEERRSKGDANVLALALAKLDMSAGRTDACLQKLEKLRMDLAPKDPLLPSVLWFLGLTYYQQQQYGKSRGAYEALLKIEPAHGPALNNLSYLLAEDMKRPEEALPLAERAASFWQINDADRANVLDTLGRVQFLAGKLLEAELTLQRSIQLRNMPVNRLHLGEVLMARGRLVEAQSEIEKAEQLAKTAGDKTSLARIAELQKDLKKSIGSRPSSKDIEKSMNDRAKPKSEPAPAPRETRST